MAGKVIITCALTGSGHTPSMSPYLPYTVGDVIDQGVAAARGGRGRAAPARQEPGGRQPVGRSGAVRRVREGDQGTQRRDREHLHRRRHRDERPGAAAGRARAQARAVHAEPGHDELRQLPDDRPLPGAVQVRLGGAVPGVHPGRALRVHLRRHRVHAQGGRAADRHPVRGGGVRHLPPVHAGLLPGSRAGARRRCSSRPSSGRWAAPARTSTTSCT